MDGNKRTALAAAVTFLEWNDRIFSPFNEDEVFDFINGLTMTEDDPDKSMNEIADWFETLAKAEKSHAGKFQKTLESIK